MTNYTHFPISGDPPAVLRLSPPPPTTTTAAAQQLVPYHPPKKKKRTKLFRAETPAGTTSSDGGMADPSFAGAKSFRVGTGSGNGGSSARPRKPDPSAPKITRPCTECGKKFWSWKALFGHMRCHPERQWRGINPPANHRPPEASFSGGVAEMSEEEHEVAACLLMLANGPGPACLEVEKEGVVITVNPNIANINPDYESITNSGDSFRFECSSCKKVFGSHQALGGHRASHKNVKGCFAIHRTGGGDVAEGSGDMAEGGSDVAEMVAGLGHKCDVCFRVFSSGQALGGHKRCHFEKGVLNCFDLNLPAPIEDYNDFNDSVSCFSSGLALDLRLGI